MSALDMAIQMADMSYGLDDRLRPDDLIMSASKELADLRSEKSRLAQENIRLNNNEDFLDSRIAELEAMTQWQPIETCPVETEIIVGNCFSKVVFQCEIMENRINAKWYTHWMPLPKPPEEK